MGIQKTKTLWLDIDGVLLDYTRAFVKYAGLAASYEEMTEYDLSVHFDSKEECRRIMNEFADSDEFSELYPMYPNLSHTIAKLRNLGFKVVGMTQLPESDKARISRLDNINNMFGNIFDELVFTWHGTCKLDYIEDRQGDVDILIEDQPVLLTKAERRGKNGDVKVLAIRHPYNAEALVYFRHVPIFDDTTEALNSIILEHIHG